MKKTLIILTCALLGAANSYSQSTQSDSRLLVKYSQDELSQMEEATPVELEFLSYCIENACQVVEYPASKAGRDDRSYPEVAVVDIENVNFFELGVELQSTVQTFKVSGHNKMIVVYTEEQVRSNFKNK